MSDRDESAYMWNDKDLEEARSASVLLAADVVYSPELTQAFFDMLDKIMTFGVTKVPPQKPNPGSFSCGKFFISMASTSFPFEGLCIIPSVL